MMKSRPQIFLSLLLLVAPSCSTSGDVLELQQDPTSISPSSDSSDSALGDKRGSRLKPLYARLTGGDGARVTLALDRFYDTLLSTNCLEYPTEDGVARCLPQSTIGSSQPIYYLDTACTNVALTFASGSPAPAFGGEMPPPNRQLRVYKVGTVVTPSALYQKSGATCSSVALPGSTYTVYNATVMAPTDFVTLDRQIITIP